MKTFLSLLCLAATSFPWLDVRAQSSTAPVGYLAYSFPATTTATVTYLGAPLARASVYAGTASSTGTDTINTTGTAWTENQFVQVPCHVLITSGEEAGRTLRILGNNATRLTVDVTDDSTQTTGLDTTDFAVGAGDGFEIVADDTLGSFFGTTPAAMILAGGADAETADQVGLWNRSSGNFDFYYFNTSVGHWVAEGDAAMSDASDFIIAPGAAMAIVRQAGRADARMVLTGLPPTVAPLLKTTGGDVLQYYGVPFPVDILLGQLNITKNWTRKKSEAKADDLAVYQAAHAKWRFYHEQKNGVWLRGTGTGAKNGLAIPAGSVLGFLKHGAVSGADSFLQVALPYSP